jgi:hypothetical protein
MTRTYDFVLMDYTKLQIALTKTQEKRDRFGTRTTYDYAVLHNGEAVMTKSGLSVPGEAGDPKHDRFALESALTYASLKPGDTDDDYFDGYTPEQIAWVEKYGDDLSYLEEYVSANITPSKVREAASELGVPLGNGPTISEEHGSWWLITYDGDDERHTYEVVLAEGLGSYQGIAFEEC